MRTLKALHRSVNKSRTQAINQFKSLLVTAPAEQRIQFGEVDGSTSLPSLHDEVIAVRAARDRAALLPLPSSDHVAADRHRRRVGKNCWCPSRPASTPSPPRPSPPG